MHVSTTAICCSAYGIVLFVSILSLFFSFSSNFYSIFAVAHFPIAVRQLLEQIEHCRQQFPAADSGCRTNQHTHTHMLSDCNYSYEHFAVNNFLVRTILVTTVVENTVNDMPSHCHIPCGCNIDGIHFHAF